MSLFPAMRLSSTILSRASFLLLFAGMLAACAHGGKRGEEEPVRGREIAARPPSSADTPREPGRGEVIEAPPREIDEDRAIAIDKGFDTPQRQASLRVVEEGKGYLIAKRPREAAQRFTRATQIDPTNGFAYYYLGRARIAAGDRSGAVGILEKAESLLGPYPEWREEAARLLASLGAR